jgi:hypothetical protein
MECFKTITQDEMKKRNAAYLTYVKGFLVYNKGGYSTKLRQTKWYFWENGQPCGDIDKLRCAKCGKGETQEGYDACLGKLINGVEFACCGHGITELRYVKLFDGTSIEGFDVDFDKFR